jgi:hypothetical protein
VRQPEVSVTVLSNLEPRAHDSLRLAASHLTVSRQPQVVTVTMTAWQCSESLPESLPAASDSRSE